MRSPSEEAEHLKALAAKIGNGDLAAEAELAAIVGPRLETLMMVRVRNADQAKDLAQEAWIALMLSLRRGGAAEIQNIGAYIWGVARNVANDRWRRGERDRLGVPLPPDLQAPAAADWAKGARARLVERVLADLDPIDRRILQATFAEEKDSEEVGREVGLSAAAVRQRKARLLKKLAEHPELLSRLGGEPTTS